MCVLTECLLSLFCRSSEETLGATEAGNSRLPSWRERPGCGCVSHEPGDCPRVCLHIATIHWIHCRSPCVATDEVTALVISRACCVDSKGAGRERRIERCQTELEELFKGGDKTGVCKRTQKVCVINSPHIIFHLVDLFLYFSHTIHYCTSGIIQLVAAMLLVRGETCNHVCNLITTKHSSNTNIARRNWMLMFI